MLTTMMTTTSTTDLVRSGNAMVEARADLGGGAPGPLQHPCCDLQALSGVAHRRLHSLAKDKPKLATL